MEVCHKQPLLSALLPSLRELVVRDVLSAQQQLPAGLTLLDVGYGLNPNFWVTPGLVACTGLRQLYGRGLLPRPAAFPFPQLTGLTWRAHTENEELALCDLMQHLRAQQLRLDCSVSLYTLSSQGILSCSNLTLTTLQLLCDDDDLPAWPPGLSVTTLRVSCRSAPNLRPLPSGCRDARIKVHSYTPLRLDRAALEGRGLEVFKLQMGVSETHWPDLLLSGGFRVTVGARGLTDHRVHLRVQFGDADSRLDCWNWSQPEDDSFMV